MAIFNSYVRRFPQNPVVYHCPNQDLHCGVTILFRDKPMLLQCFLDGTNEKLHLTCFVHVSGSQYKCIHTVWSPPL